jgi:hypothetical protein
MTTRPQHREAYDEIRAEIDRLEVLSGEAGRRLEVLTLRALAHGVRTYSDATHVRVGLSDQGDWFTLEGISQVGGEVVTLEDWAREIDVIMRPIQALASLVPNLVPERGTWIPFSTVVGQSWDLDVDAIIRCQGDPERRLAEDATSPQEWREATRNIPLQQPAGVLYVWFAKPAIGDETMIFVLIAKEGEEPLMRPLIAQDLDFARGLGIHAENAARELGMTAVLREFTCFQVLDEVTP